MKSPWIRLLVLLIVLSINFSPLLAQAAQPTSTGNAVDSSQVYIIQLQDAPLASYRGEIAGLEATNPGVRGERKLDSSSPASVAYLDYLKQQQDLFLQTMEQVLGRPVEALYQYQHAFNGVAVQLTSLEAKVVTRLPGVRMVQQETIEYPLTDRGPAFIGAPSIWDGSATPSGIGTMGEGIIIGVIDTGINHASPSFADIGGDGYDHENPWGAGNYVGICDTDPTFCNDKLIGAWCMVAGDPGDPNCPEDSNGHGSHTSSTAGGNVVTAAVGTPNGYVYTATISGVAPHANLIMYDACVDGCPGAALLAAANQALADGVDVINYSISGGNNPYYDSVELAFLALTDAGVYVSTSAGNNGPAAGSVAHRSPWVASTAASTHDRVFANSLVDMAGDTPAPADMVGRSMTIGYGPAPIVYAGDYGDAMCLNPFPGGTFDGEIVVCDRGINARVDKGANVLAGGAGGMILANTSPDQSLVADPHYLPAVHLNSTDGDALRAWLAGGGTVFTGTIAGTEVVFDPTVGDIIAAFSSRGPNSTFEVLKPDMAAPGVDILAASRSDIGYQLMGGTSMASPHNAGAGALLMAAHPEWSPAQIKSALMTTAVTDLISEDTQAASTPFDKGAGRDELTRAALAGLVLDEGEPNYSDANPDLGGDPKTLNLASMYDEQCFGTCSFTRTVSNALAVTTTWQAIDDPQAQFSVTITPDLFTLAPGATQTLVISADVNGLSFDEWFFAYAILREISLVAEPDLGLTKDDGGITVEPGDTITYTLAYTNSGDAPSTGAMLTETVPASTTFNAAVSDPGWVEVVTGTYVYDLGTIDPHTGGTILFAVDVDAALMPPTTITNTAEVGDDYLGTAAWASAATPVVPPAVEEYTVYLPAVFRAYSLTLEFAAPTTRYAAGKYAQPSGPIFGLAPDAYLVMAVQTWAPPPIIEVDPTALANSQAADVTETVPFTVSNIAPAGYRDLEWSIVEDILPTGIEADWGDSFDTYAVGSSMHGQGGWKGWFNTPAATAYVSDLYALTPGNSVEVSNTTDLVHEYSGYTADQWVYTAWQYIPTGFTGESYFILLNSYDDAGTNLNWSTQINFQSATNLVVNEGNSGGTLPIVYDQWVELRVEIDLTGNTQSFYYNGDLLFTGTWTEEQSGGGALNIAAVDLYANSASPVYYDSISLEQDWGYWTDYFDIYDLGSSMHGQGGWKGWGNTPGATAYVTDTYAQTPNQSIDVSGSSDLVHEYSGYTTDLWVYTAWQYIPGDLSGQTYFILLNSYDDAGANLNWSTELQFDSASNTVINDGPAGGTLPIVYDQWVEIRVEIDLINDIQNVYYDGQLLFADTWTGGMSGGGVLNIAAVDLFANGASPVYYDTISLAPGQAQPCQLPSDIPWLSVAPDTGVTPPGGSAFVEVTFDSTGMSAGTYNSTLCVFSNDETTPVIPVPVSLTVTP
jgi:uncharacterized repeat protein (TIGR01451 family)